MVFAAARAAFFFQAEDGIRGFHVTGVQTCALPISFTNKPVPGRFYLYKYDPKTKEQMPYYDAMPLVLITDVTPDGWYGINFHYMPPVVQIGRASCRERG